jgi:hypothetical protein
MCYKVAPCLKREVAEISHRTLADPADPSHCPGLSSESIQVIQQPQSPELLGVGYLGMLGYPKSM